MTGRWHQPQPGDLYQVLGVSPDASRAEIIRAYRFKARAAHPDTHPADPQAAARFRALTSAYQVLSDPARRGDYDRHRGGAAVPEPPAWPGPARRPFPGSAPLRAGPTWVQPPDAAGQATAGGSEPDALTVLASLLGLSPGSRPGWPAGERHWPAGEWDWPADDRVWGWGWEWIW